MFFRVSSDRLLLWVALQLVELDTVQLLKAFATVLTRKVVVGLRRVLLHVPVERGSLPTLIAADLTLKWGLSGVCPPVHLQVVFPLKGLATRLTDKISYT